MDLYLAVKIAHIISATILFGTGIGIAQFMLFGQHKQPLPVRHFAARMTVQADYLFTLPAVIVQPLTGFWLIHLAGFDWTDYWLCLTYALYLLAGLCWIPVIIIQIRLKQMLDRAMQGDVLDEPRFRHLFRWWFALGWPAFGGLVVVFFLMVAKPSW